MLLKQTKPVLLSGNIVDTNGKSAYGFILVNNGLINCVSISKPEVPPGTIEYDAGKNSYIFPGLINLHTHIDYNLLPMWENPNMYNWDNRFEWRHNTQYKNDISAPISSIRNNWKQKIRNSNNGPNIELVFQALSEIQAVAGGTTTLQESTKIDEGCEHFENRMHLLIRNTGSASDMGLPNVDLIDSQTDFFDPQPIPDGSIVHDTSSWKPIRSKGFNNFLEKLPSGSIKGTLVHLAEGRSGVGLPQKGVDIYSRAEFNAFKTQISSLNPEDIESTNFGIIHGCGIDFNDEETLSFLLKYNIHIIWSPVSNLLLYGDTMFSKQLWPEQLLTCLGSDWSPSGSKHVWDESKFARFFFDTLNIPVTDLSLYHMITKNPAQALQIPAGSIQKDFFGDFFILECEDQTITPLEALFKYDDSAIKAVITSGVPVYGEQEIFLKWGIRAQRLPKRMGEVASTKFVNLPNELEIDLETDLDKLEDLFRSQGISNFSFPLVKDDEFYKNTIEDLKKYTISYAQNIKKHSEF